MKNYIVFAVFLLALFTLWDSMDIHAQSTQNGEWRKLRLLEITPDGDAIIDCSQLGQNCLVVLPPGPRN